MGNDSSNFEEKFYHRYSFIAVADHPYFGTIKIYRKIFPNFNYIMVAEVPVNTDMEYRVLQI